MRLSPKLLAPAAGVALVIGSGLGVVSAKTSSDHGDTASTQPVTQSNQPSDREDRGTDHRGQTSDREDRGADRDDPALSGNAAERAKAAATAAVPGATVRSVERDRDDHNPQVAYEVELTRADGSSVEVELDASYKVLHLDPDHHDDGQDRDD